MKRLSLRHPTCAALPLFMAFLLAGRASADDGQPHWYASLYAANSDWIQVDVDLSDLARNVLMSNTVVTVRMMDGTTRRLGDRKFPFQDTDLSVLSGGKRYREYFPNPFTQATRAVGIKLSSSVGPAGRSFRVLPHNGATPVHSGLPARKSLSVPPDATLTPASAIIVGRMPTTRQIVLHLPQDGQPNHNQTIGPFCCTGTTATIRDSAGKAAGYVYFFGFDDAVDLPDGKSSAAATIRILLSAAPAMGETASQSGSAVFDAASWSATAARSVQVGSLRYTITLDARTLAMPDRTRFDMGSLRATVRVAGVE